MIKDIARILAEQFFIVVWAVISFIVYPNTHHWATLAAPGYQYSFVIGAVLASGFAISLMIVLKFIILMALGVVTVVKGVKA